MRKYVLTIFLTCASVVSVCAETADTDGESAKFNRGIGMATTVFIPKGTFGMGATFSYNTLDLGQQSDDFGYSMLFDLLNGIKADMYTFGVAPHFMIFVKDNLGVGARFGYNRSMANLGNASLSLGDDMNFGISGYHFQKHMMTAAVTMRYYMAIANSKRFAIFAEMRAIGGYGESKLWRDVENEKYGTYQINQKASLNFVPGISIFAQDNVAVEVAIGLLGVNYNRTEQIRNQVEHSVMQNSGANFKINPLSIEIGVCAYFYSNKAARKANRDR